MPASLSALEKGQDKHAEKKMGHKNVAYLCGTIGFSI